MGRMESEGDACLEPQGLFPLNVPVSRDSSRPPLRSLNILALPAQGEPTCIRGRGCYERSLNSYYSLSAAVLMV
jgi:hypothetical protein